MMSVTEAVISQFPNVYEGSLIGAITNVSQSLIGCRITAEEQSGTIKFVGNITNSPAIWLGIDWDNEKRGRHNGSFKGNRYFNTRTPNSGSFMKPEKVSLGTSLEEALVTRYAMCAECQIITRNASLFQPGGDPNSGVRLEVGQTTGHIMATVNSKIDAEYIEGENADDSKNNVPPLTLEIFTSGGGDPKAHWSCGAKGAKKALARLLNVSVPGLPVFCCLRDGEVEKTEVKARLWPTVGGNLGEMLPRLTELDISCSLFSKWTEVARICRQLPKLSNLNVGRNLLRLHLPQLLEEEDGWETMCDTDRRLRFDLDVDTKEAEAICSVAFVSLRRFVSVHTPLMTWHDLARILAWMPQLKELCIAYNSLGNLPTLDTSTGKLLSDRLQNLTELDLTSTEQSDFDCILAAVGHSTNLKDLLLTENNIDHIQLSKDCTNVFKSLNLLTIRGNKLSDWESINELIRLPSLEALIITQNPILSTIDIETGRQEVIARLPKLKMLNRQEILTGERRGANLDFLKRYGKAFLEAEKSGDNTLMQAFNQKFPSYAHICDIYGAPECGEIKAVVRSIKEGLLELNIFCEPDSPKGIQGGIERRVPARMTINHLRTLARRLFSLPVRAKIDLVTVGSRPGYTDVEVPLEADTRELGFYGLASGDKLVVRWSS